MNQEIKQCQNCKSSFVVDATDCAFYEKMQVPVPVLCPDCRMKRKLVWRNERTLYKNTCKLCGQSVITMYNPNSPYIIYCYDCWYSDKWDPFQYAMDYDPEKPFFNQVGELIKKVPKIAMYSNSDIGSNINSEYCNFAGGNKDCYLIFNSGPHNENCAYSRGLAKDKDVFDSYFGDGIERVYEGVNVHKSAGIAYGQNVVGCLDSWFLLNCSGCQNCFGCVNMRNASYRFFNEQLTKEDWKKRVSEITGSYEKIEDVKKKFEAHALKFPMRENNNLKSVNSYGNYLFESKSCISCFEATECEDVHYSFSSKFAKDCYDLVGHGRNSELLLECVGAGTGQRYIGVWWADNSHDIAYCFAARASENCVGCDSVRNGKYCILNKRYEKEEYEKIRAHIVDELKSKNLYGLFFPPELAFFAYNETLAQENYPLTKEQALAEGFRWEEDIPQTRGKETLKPEQIPDHIKDVPDTILDEILACVECGRNYRLIKPELDMYRRALIPIPRKCFNCRHMDRVRRRGALKLHPRACAKCGKEMQTTYPPDSPYIVYCEQCYQTEVV
ncbi:MAG: hypothetical protein A2946_01080 [Candidatus Liptonbacteria bacterium RIFCSPLOWO2_01_FULL_53_13]|uniref:Zinc-binding domain-containing protein n=1 Tax=Candidatus Liptonbacteria bacterium RIFCSPLOWO2_01_FULL_53_13 TaxID=1798651 RepID=A0A1G2CJ59_9BACT|nr:MAG: hypothetical protein A2946_01080 [Candidatus Liptonbacteria bacterium RIFCSPLOWO2_01_FULL_53_13]